jgi:pyridoxal phosphate enzyme (YggS family)
LRFGNSAKGIYSIFTLMRSTAKLYVSPLPAGHRSSALRVTIYFYVSTMPPSLLALNLANIEQQISAAATRSGRSRDAITLIAVSKTHPASAIRDAYDAGLRHFGENRVQEWEGKRSDVLSLPDAVWHLIGHLQSNKAARASRIFHTIDAVDDLSLADRLDRARSQEAPRESALLAVAGSRKLRTLIEVRVAHEDNKHGVNLTDLPAFVEKIALLPELDLAGLMCIPPFLEDPEQVRPFFRKLREIRDDLAKRMGRPLPVLSMGMSHDFSVAIEEGATEVRIGTALFGSREGAK